MRDLFIKKGDQYLVSAGGVVLLAADTIYGPPHETTPQGIANAKRLMDAILAVASENGFKRRDLFETILSKGERSLRLGALAREVDRHIGATGFAEAKRRAGADL